MTCFLLSIFILNYNFVSFSPSREKMNGIPISLAQHISKKQYLHATQLVIEATSLGKGKLEGIEGLKELSQEIINKKEVRNHLF